MNPNLNFDEFADFGQWRQQNSGTLADYEYARGLAEGPQIEDVEEAEMIEAGYETERFLEQTEEREAITRGRGGLDPNDPTKVAAGYDRTMPRAEALRRGRQ